MIEWVVLLVALVALGLSIAAVAKPCSSNFGDTCNPCSCPTYGEDECPTGTKCDCSKTCMRQGYGSCLAGSESSSGSPGMIPGGKDNQYKYESSKMGKVDCKKIKEYCNSLDYNSCYDSGEKCSFDGQECTFSPDTYPECINKVSEKQLVTNGHGKHGDSKTIPSLKPFRFYYDGSNCVSTTKTIAGRTTYPTKFECQKAMGLIVGPGGQDSHPEPDNKPNHLPLILGLSGGGLVILIVLVYLVMTKRLKL